jgi:adenylyltransferase/sulfurtransferase
MRATSAARVLVVGVGALGCAAADALVHAGVGHLGLVDPDVVERSNLHRQLLHRHADLGRPKIESAAAKLGVRYPAVRLTLARERIDAVNVDRLLAGYDCIVDATDGITSKFVLNDGAVRLGVVLVHAGIVRFQGQVMTVVPRRSACLRCLFEEPLEASDMPSCQEAGVLGSLAGTIGLLQAAEVVRYLSGTGPLLTDRLLTYDALAGRWRQVRLHSNPACAICGPGLAAARHNG